MEIEDIKIDGEYKDPSGTIYIVTNIQKRDQKKDNCIWYRQKGIPNPQHWGEGHDYREEFDTEYMRANYFSNYFSKI